MKKAILFIVFNRPDTTAKVFEAIRASKPPRLYIAADGPRLNRLDDVAKCEEVRDIVSDIDWACEVKTLYQDQNLGCKLGVSSGIDWFFKQEEEGIILEDDVVPSSDFFIFCESMLEKYRFDERVMMITGTNYLGNSKLKDAYFFSKHFSIWGWATWRRAWALYDLEMKAWENQKVKDNINYEFNSGYIAKHFSTIFDSLKNSYVDTWDIQWVFACICNSGLCVTPRVNLITNIGVEGVHSSGLTDSHFLKTESLNLKNDKILNKPVIADAFYDSRVHKLKNLPALSRRLIIEKLKKLHIYTFCRFFYKKIKLLFLS
jgi:hypothetical protein